MARLPRFATGSDQRSLIPLSQNFAVITNTNAITADSAGLVNSSPPVESANVGGLISSAGAKYVIERDPTVSCVLRFSLGHTSDATGRTAVIKIRGHRTRDIAKKGKQYRGSLLVSATLVAGAIDDTNSMLLPSPVPAEAASIKHVSTITINSGGDQTLTPPGARLISSGVGGIAELVVDDASCTILEIEISMTGGGGAGAASCATGEYTEL